MEGLRSLDKHTTVIKLKNAGFSSLPEELFAFRNVELLDLSGNPLSCLPDHFADSFPKLKTAFFSDCCFKIFPDLSRCHSLEMIAFKGNGMQTVPEETFPPRLRWLILTNNAIQALPTSIGNCYRLEKCMLAGNCLQALPQTMTKLEHLALLRLAANKFSTLPDWLFQLPSLCWLAFSGNPCAGKASTRAPEIPWSALEIEHVLGEGASGLISQARLRITGKQVAVKVFKGEVTSDGLPSDEMDACIAAGAHPHLIDPLASITGHPERKRGLVLELVPSNYTNLGLPPSMITCTRDNFDRRLSSASALNVLRGIAAAAVHLHSRKLAHGDLYAHNILINDKGHALFGDFGAATLYEAWPIEPLEVKAFGWLVDDLMSISSITLHGLRDTCTQSDPKQRPTFAQIVHQLNEVGIGSNAPGAAN